MSPSMRSTLQNLLLEVDEARRLVAAHRRTVDARFGDGIAVQRDLLTALERYAAALTEAGQPVPRRVVVELHLYRGILAVT